MKTINRILTICLAAAAVASCGFLDLKPNVIMKDNFYKNQRDALHGLAGVYGAMNNENFYGSLYSIVCSGNDDLCYYNGSLPIYQIQTFEHNASSGEIYDLWSALYLGIKNANAFMNAMEGSELDKEKHLYSEARFMRAYYHYLLAQCWGDVPLEDFENASAEKLKIAKTPQYDILKWVIAEIEESIPYLEKSLEHSPSRVVKTTAQGILARICLFTAGESIDRKGDAAEAYFKKAMDNCKAVIESNAHALNPEYSDVFINMIADKYDTEYHESMWEVEFKGHREDANRWSNGRIGELNGLSSRPVKDFEQCNGNYSYAFYNGSLQLWDLYWQTDRTEEENTRPDIIDARQDWNMPPYNYAGNKYFPPFGNTDPKVTSCLPGIDKTPYVYNKIPTSDNILIGPGMRNCGKFRREAKYEGHLSSALLYNQINFPILRYADVLLMYAESINEYYKTPSEEAYDCLKQIRDRAHVATRPYSDYSSYESFQEFVRNERGRELCFEAVRKYDLIRWGEYIKKMKDYSLWTSDLRWAASGNEAAHANRMANIAERHIYLPIPAVEIGVNPNLKQNPLW